MEKIEVNETEFKILHLFQNIPGQDHRVSWLSVKLKIHPNTVRTHISALIDKKLIRKHRTSTGSVLYFLVNGLKNKIDDCCVVVRV